MKIRWINYCTEMYICFKKLKKITYNIAHNVRHYYKHHPRFRCKSHSSSLNTHLKYY